MNTKEPSVRYVAGEGCIRCPTLTIIGDYPGAEEVKYLRPFVGPSGQILREVLCSLKIPLDQVYFTYLIKVFPHSVPSGLDINTWVEPLYDELDMVSASNLILLGGIVGAALNPEFTDMEHMHGKSSFSEFGKYIITHVVSPSTITSSQQRKLFKWDILTVWNDIEGKR